MSDVSFALKLTGATTALSAVVGTSFGLLEEHQRGSRDRLTREEVAVTLGAAIIGGIAGGVMFSPGRAGHALTDFVIGAAQVAGPLAAGNIMYYSYR